MPILSSNLARPSARTIMAGVAAVVLAVLALTAWSLWDERQLAWRHSRQNAQNLISAIGDNIEDKVALYDLSLRAVIEGLQAPGIWDLRPDMRARVLFDGSADDEDFGSIIVLDDKGTVILTSHGRVQEGTNLAERDYFQIHRDHADAGRFLSAPFKGRQSGLWLIEISRRINRSDGSFGGVVAGSIRLSFFQRIFDGVDIGADGVLGLYRNDGRMLMRKPYDEGALGRIGGQQAVFDAARGPDGEFENHSNVDSVDRFFVYHQLGTLPLRLSLGTSREAIFGDWRQKAAFSGMAMVVLMGLAAMLAWELRRELARTARAETLLRDAVESISEGFVIYDEDERLVLCNEAYRKLYPATAPLMVPGAPFEDMLRSGVAAGNAPRARGREDEWIAERLREHRDPDKPFEHMLADGRHVLVSERRMASGGRAGLRIDITALKAVQASLRESQAQLNQAERVSKIGSMMRDFHAQTTRWSDEMYRIFGVTRDNFVPDTHTFLAHVHPEDRDRVMASIAASEQGVESEPYEFRIIRPDGAVRWVYRESEVMRDTDSAPIGRISTYKDITGQREAEQREAALESQLRHSQKLEALGTLAGGIAHDLNNTLVPIIALTKLAMKRALPASAEREELEVIAQAGEHARNLVKQILAFSRKQGATQERVDAGALVHSSLQMLRATLPSTIRIAERIDQAPSLFADRAQLQQVIINLVTNAAQAIGDQLGTITVAVRALAAMPGASADAGGGAVSISVADTGCGIDETILGRVFEPFFTTKEVGQGTGLGLAVAHGIITDHGGTIECRSKRGEGTEFIVMLPAAARAASSMQPAA